jgi:hypothetical protein
MSSNNINDVEDVEELIDSNKDKYSVEQYAELKYYVESQKQQFMAQAYAGVSKILKAVGNGEASSVEGLDALQQYEAEMPGIVNYATKVIIGQYRDSVDEDPSVVKDTRKEYPKYEKAQDGVEDYLTLRHMIGFRPNIKENEVRLNEVMNLIEECDAPIEVKYQMTQDVLKDAERMFKPGFGVEAGKRGGGEARSKAYKQLKKTMNDHVAATGDTSIYKRMGTSLYEMYSIMNEDPEFDYNVYIKETFSDLISQTQQARSDSMFLSSLSPKARAQRTGGKTIVRTGMQNGRRVIQYSDGSIEYGD